MKMVKKLISILLAAMMVLAMASCGKSNDGGKSENTDGNTPNSSADNNTDGSSDNSGSTERRKIIVGTGIGGAPYEYVNDDGEPDGYDVKAMMAVAELLPQYEFEFVPTTIDDIMTSMSNNKIQVGLANCFWTPERAEKYTIPEENLGACKVGLVLRTEDAECDTIEKCVDKGLKITPVAPTDGFRVIIDKFNEEHPDKAIDFGTIEITSLADFYLFLAEGRYDYLLMSAGIYDMLIADENGELHNLSDQLVQHIITAVGTYALCAPGEEQLAADISGAIAQLKADGTLSKLQVEYIGEDQFQYMTD